MEEAEKKRQGNVVCFWMCVNERERERVYLNVCMCVSLTEREWERERGRECERVDYYSAELVCL